MELNSPRRVPVIVADILRLWSSVRPLAWGCLSPGYTVGCHASECTLSCLDIYLPLAGLVYSGCDDISLTFSIWENLIIISRGFGTSCSEFSSTIQYSFSTTTLTEKIYGALSDILIFIKLFNIASFSSLLILPNSTQWFHDIGMFSDPNGFIKQQFHSACVCSFVRQIHFLHL